MAKTDATKNMVRINTYDQGFLPQKAPEPTADMVKDALDGFLSGNFEMVDSRCLDLVGSRGQKVAGGDSKVSTFSDLEKAGVKFGASSDTVRTASYEPLRLVEALDRGLDASGRHEAEAPGLTYREKRVTHKKPQIKAPVITGFEMHDFDGPRSSKREPLVDGLSHYVKHYKNVH
jgi:hypothetical protein